LPDRYDSFSQLAQHETLGRDYRIRILARPHSCVLIVAPHGGLIENGTSELAALVAGPDHNLYVFEGLRSGGKHSSQHITSHRFDDPVCLALASRCAVVLSIHGCVGHSRIYLGGLDGELTGVLASHLEAAGLPAAADGHAYPGRHPTNICNRGSRARGVQLELTADLRETARLPAIATVVRAAVAEYVALLS